MMILNTFVVVVAAVVAGTFLLPKQYESRMKILVKNERADPIVSATPSGNDYRGEVANGRNRMGEPTFFSPMSRSCRSGRG